MKMKVELPKLKRFCCCIPLRYGLIICGYLRLVLLLVMFTVVILSIVAPNYPLTPELIAIKSLFMLLLVTDTCITIVSLIGSHRKTPKLLHVFYIYNIILLCIFTLFFTWAIGNDLYNMENVSRPFGYSHFVHIIQTDILMGVLFVGLQAYMIFLIRSEVDKLNNNTNCKFDNLAAEATCTLENGRY